VLGDFERFAEAEKEATGGLRGALEPISGLFQEYLRMVDARRLSAELGLPHEEVMRLLGEEKSRAESLAVLHLWMEQGQAERRESLMRDYLTLVYALGFELMPFEPLGYEEFGGQAYADLIRQSPEFVAAFGSGGQPVHQPVADVKKSLTTSSAAKVNLTRDRVRLPGGGTLEVSIQPKLVVGDTAELIVTAAEDVHVLIVHHSSDQFVTELYPGTTGKPTLLKAGTERVVQWETTEPGGPESIVVYASSQPIHNTTRGGKAADEFTVFERREFFSSRGVPKNVKAADTSPQSARPAPIVEARVGYFLQD